MADLSAQELSNLNGRNAGEIAVANTNTGILSAITKNQGPDTATKIANAAVNSITGKTNEEFGYIQSATANGKFLTGFVEGENPLHACSSYT